MNYAVQPIKFVARARKKRRESLSAKVYLYSCCFSFWL